MAFKKTIVFVLFAVVICAALIVITVKKTQDNATMHFINASLYDLDEEIDMLIHLSKNYSNDSYLIKKTESLVLNKLVIISTAKPDITKLHDTPLDALYKTLKYLKEYHWNSKGNEKVFIFVQPYINQIDNDVTDLKLKNDRIFSNPLGKKRGEMSDSAQ